MVPGVGTPPFVPGKRVRLPVELRRRNARLPKTGTNRFPKFSKNSGMNRRGEGGLPSAWSPPPTYPPGHKGGTSPPRFPAPQAVLRVEWEGRYDGHTFPGRGAGREGEVPLPVGGGVGGGSWQWVVGGWVPPPSDPRGSQIALTGFGNDRADQLFCYVKGGG